ncbi:MAG: tetraacyldisaccharide 4'-kinase [Planctomycetota bacterium]
MNFVAWYRELIGGRKTCLRSLARTMLGVAEWPYAWIVRRRNQAFDAGRRPVEPVAARVISVGNLTVGGTGKTPFVAWLVEQLQQQFDREHQLPGAAAKPNTQDVDLVRARRGRIGIVSRGYGGDGQRPNDEAQELAQLLPGVPHVQNPRRVLACQRLIAEHAVSVIVADDAFQHRSLQRDLDIVLLDGLDPFGGEHLLPRGWLREPVESLGRADVVVLTRCDLLSLDQRDAVRERVRQLAPEALWLEVAQRPRRLRAADGMIAGLDELQRGRWLAFCGIGNPLGFRRTLQAANVSVVGWREYPDHHAYSATDYTELAAWGEREVEATGLLCTGKDLVKIPRQTLGRLPLWSLSTELQLERGQEEFLQLLRTHILHCQ